MFPGKCNFGDLVFVFLNRKKITGIKFIQGFLVVVSI